MEEYAPPCSSTSNSTSSELEDPPDSQPFLPLAAPQAGAPRCRRSFQSIQRPAVIIAMVSGLASIGLLVANPTSWHIWLSSSSYITATSASTGDTRRATRNILADEHNAGVLGSIFDHIAEEIDEVVISQIQPSAEHDDNEKESDNDVAGGEQEHNEIESDQQVSSEEQENNETETDNEAALPGQAVEGDMEWVVAFSGYARVRSTASMEDLKNILGQKGPQGALVVGKAEGDWVELLSEPGFIAIASNGEPLLERREVSYMILASGTCSEFSSPMHDIPDTAACDAAGVALGLRLQDILVKDGICIMYTSIGEQRTVCSTQEYDFSNQLDVELDNQAEAHAGEAGPPTTTAVHPTVAEKSETTRDQTEPTAVEIKAETTKADDENCDSCCPVERQAPTVVIPTFERDLCKLKVTARSITEHDKGGFLGKVIICWVSKRPVSDFAGEIEEVKEALYPHGEVEVIDMLVTGHGWESQQAAKLKVASRVSSEFYLVLDSKNAILRDLTQEDFFTGCNQAKIFGRYNIWDEPGVHHDWFYNAASVLGVGAMDYGKWPSSITPITMHTQTVKDLLDKLGEPQEFGECSGGLCDALARAATEFTLYLTYVGTMTDLKCTHSIEERHFGNEISASLWRDGEDAKKNTFDQVKAIAEHDATGNGNCLFFGAQAGAVDAFEGDERYQLLQYLFTIYSEARLYEFSDWDDMANCVVGAFWNG